MEKLDQKWGMDPEGWVTSYGDSRDPTSLRFSVPGAKTKLRRIPWVCGSSVVCHPFKCSHFQVTILSLALSWA